MAQPSILVGGLGVAGFYGGHYLLFAIRGLEEVHARPKDQG